MKRCQNCGNILEDDARFCENCGAQISQIKSMNHINNDSMVQKESKAVKSGKGLGISIGVLGAAIVFMLVIAVITNINNRGSKDYLNDDYKQLQENIKNSSVKFSEENNRKYEELAEQMKDIDSCDEDKVKKDIKELNNVIAKLKQYNSKVDDYSEQIKEYNKSVKENKLTDECDSYKSDSENALNNLKDKIKSNDIDELEECLKKLKSETEKYSKGKDNFIIWKKYKNDMKQIDETARGKKISGYDKVSKKNKAARIALLNFKEAIKDDTDKSIKKMKEKAESSIKKYKKVVNETEAEKTIVYKYKYVPSVRDDYDSYGGEFIAYDSRNYVMDVNEIEDWLSRQGATPREIACWFTLAINEISARYGGSFSTNSLQTYFNYRTWYSNYGYDPNDISGAFTSVEKANFDNFGRKRNEYCEMLGISSSAKEYSYDEFAMMLSLYAY